MLIFFSMDYLNKLEKVSKNKTAGTVFPLIGVGSQISAAPLVIYIEISASLLISAAHLNAALIRIVIIYYRSHKNVSYDHDSTSS